MLHVWANNVLTSLQEYIHRVGRTARAGGKGNALLLLMPEELGFLKYLKLAKVNNIVCISMVEWTSVHETDKVQYKD